MEKIEYKAIDIVHMYLEQRGTMSDREKDVLLESINLINHPMFVAK